MENLEKECKINKEKSFANGFNFYKLFWIFYIGCLAGVIVETIWCIVTNGYFEYRTALILEPLNPVYGVGAVVISLILCNMKKCNNVVIYFSSFVIGGLFETACSLFQETVFGTVSWMYKPSNLGILGNRTSLLYCFLWGFLGILWVRVIYPFLSKTIEKIPNKIGRILTIFLAFFVCIDIIFSSGAVLRQKERRNEIPPKTHIDIFYDTHFTDDVLKLFYHNITVIN
ncbi:MAG: putative ABC transporter permease [Clostridia bacterium]